MTAPQTNPAARIRAALDRLAGDRPALGIAVSGGGDSVALMHIAAGWARARRVMVATVDHGLRAESAEEAWAVAREAARLGLPHETLHWQRADETGNLMAAARDARLRLLSDWARRQQLPAVALGHTADDQAETLMMRLARGSGLDGLAAMAEQREAHDMLWLRPMLGVGRAELRDWLCGRGIGWIDDPSNENEDFERIRIRKAIAACGLDPAALARAAIHIGEARDALTHYAAAIADKAAVARGSIALPLQPFRDAPAEIRRRLLIAACRWITGAAYPPRRATVMNALSAVEAGSRVTLDGALIEASDGQLRVIREPAAALRANAGAGPVWDNRWQIRGLEPGQRVSALGYDALTELPWRGTALSRDEAAASPAIRDGGRLIAAPLLHRPDSHEVWPIRGAADFRRLVVVH
ncbi:tRNA lysidine(34) synthetase TilS [Paracoccus marinaquae]|uniref:tRNA(Ile)-lysidine synthase n=1 Tax=Paracoccus marinaquae TaxID=2841926 RepID=A0ABS6AIL8_9RHOB|nr:tRNA lysidine(34) synthetase TilS [Paracoccus marinaquae]MBU3030056.1 tRNA lysidine(34) synthetase TilS [Paracoccus marinaquae]